MVSGLPELIASANQTAPIGVAVVDGYELAGVGGTHPDTLFQAGSIAKAVTALVALELVAAGRLDLDADVNHTLRRWRLPGPQAVTLREILGHTAGIGVRFLPGYAQGAPVPTLIDVLDGVPPAITPAVRVDHSGFTYSGGGYAVLQQLIEDAAGTGFAELAHEAVLGPLGMTRSTFEQPLPPPWRDRAARTDWRIYPEAAAAGLWTTPTDLARFVIGVQRALAGRTVAVHPASPALMLRPHTDLPPEGEWSVLPTLGVRPPDRYGLGFFLEGNDRFSHLGGASGFFSILSASTQDGSGAVVMTASDPDPIAFAVLLAIGDEYGWSGLRAPLASS
jgi:CubicO group peptidase (beta-lactamase class C family)